MATKDSSDPQTWAEGKGVWLVTAALVVVGLASRIAPLLNLGGRLLRQFASEDGYLMMTI
ncbi:MAG: hypothetical protein JO329_04910, partial [Planctomycetaceae bacterium]|nr:hypothetical protein [Planctomycetaceae bacterium]